MNKLTPSPKEARFYKALTPEHVQMMVEKGPMFRSMWEKRLTAKKGMTKDTIEIFDLFFAEWLEGKQSGQTNEY